MSPMHEEEPPKPKDVVELRVVEDEATTAKEEKQYSLVENIQRMFHWFCMSFLFMIFINLCIVINTVCLALDYYPLNAELQ